MRVKRDQVAIQILKVERKFEPAEGGQLRGLFQEPVFPFVEVDLVVIEKRGCTRFCLGSLTRFIGIFRRPMLVVGLSLKLECEDQRAQINDLK